MDDPFRVQNDKKRSLRLKRSKRSLWVEASFVAPDISDEQAISYAKTDGYISSIMTNKQFTFALFFSISLLSILLFRVGELQIVRGAEYTELSNANRLRIVNVRADRGLIYDRFKTPLVQNIPNYVATIQSNLLPEDVDARHQLLNDLYTGFFISYIDESLFEFINNIDKLKSDKSKKDKEIVIAEYINQDHAILLQIMSQEIPALNVNLFSVRNYLNEGPVIAYEDETNVYPPVKSLSHVLGYLTSLKEGEYAELNESGYLFNDVLGRTGLEGVYETELRGVNGAKHVEVNAFGVSKQILAQEEPEDGLSLITTLDVEMQRKVESITNRYLESEGKTKASIVIINPQNGEVLSLVSLPTFDNNDFARGVSSSVYSSLIEDESNPLFNRSVSGEYPSGSTFKPIVAAAALQEGVVKPLTSFLSTGGIGINIWFFPDWKAGGHGQTNVYKALADSVNTYFYIIGGGYGDLTGLGVAKISEYARMFGLSSPLTIDLPGEGSGFLPSKEWKEEVKNERWYIGDTYHLAIGQGDLLVTPLQVASFISTFANGGTVYRPHLAKNLVDENMNIIKDFEPEILNENFIDPEHMDVVQTGLRRVVYSGSGKRLEDLPIDVSGKTGTAQWHSEKDPHAWFVGYAPSKNPQIAFSILVEEGEEGSGITVSIAKEILQWWIKNRYEL